MSDRAGDDAGDATASGSGAVIMDGLLPFAGLCLGCPRQAPENWNPRHEPHFERTWLTHLLSRYGEWCHASDVWEPRDEWQRVVLRQRAWEVVEKARRIGLFIEADPLLGYRVTGCDDLPRYIHLHERAAEKSEDVVPGQLQLAGGGGVE